MAGRCFNCQHYSLCSDDRISSEQVWGGCKWFEDDRTPSAAELLAQIKVRPLGNTDLYVIDRAEFDALKEKYGKGKVIAVLEMPHLGDVGQCLLDYDFKKGY